MFYAFNLLSVSAQHFRFHITFLCEYTYFFVFHVCWNCYFVSLIGGLDNTFTFGWWKKSYVYIFLVMYYRLYQTSSHIALCSIPLHGTQFKLVSEETHNIYVLHRCTQRTALALCVSLFLYLYYFCNVYIGTMYDDIYLKFFFFIFWSMKKRNQLECTAKVVDKIIIIFIWYEIKRIKFICGRRWRPKKIFLKN